MEDVGLNCHNCPRTDSDILRRCGRCFNVYYCSKVCQTLDWPSHKSSCVSTNRVPNANNRNEMKDNRTAGRETKSDEIESSDHLCRQGLQTDKNTGDNGHGFANNVCVSCSTPWCFQKCSRCKDAFYCSRRCQMEDWTIHKNTCKKRLTEEEEKILAKLKKRQDAMAQYQNLQRESKGKYPYNIEISNFMGPGGRMDVNLTPEQALLRASRPRNSLVRAVQMAKLAFPLHDIKTEFCDIPWEPTFPFFHPAPPVWGRHVLVAFMYRYHEHVMRHGVYLKDAHDKDSKVEFYLDHVGDNPFPFFSYSEVKPGGYICLVDSVMHLFGDGTVGIRINNPDQVKVFDIEMVMK